MHAGSGIHGHADHLHVLAGFSEHTVLEQTSGVDQLVLDEMVERCECGAWLERASELVDFSGLDGAGVRKLGELLLMRGADEHELG